MNETYSSFGRRKYYEFPVENHDRLLWIIERQISLLFSSFYNECSADDYCMIKINTANIVTLARTSFSFIYIDEDELSLGVQHFEGSIDQMV